MGEREGGRWIGGDAYTAVAVAKKVGTGAWTVYNIFRDHLGTITHLKNGSNPADEYSFDAWGRRRDKDDWTMTLTSEPALFADRGFTAHEYLEDFKFYNMNGRLYDPVVGRFLNADPVIQDAGSTQNYNRYSYCLNNPLKYTDPTGNQVYRYGIHGSGADGGSRAGSGGGGSSWHLGTIYNQDGSISYGGPSDETVDAWLNSGLSSSWSLGGFSDYYNSGAKIRVITESRQLDWTRRNGQPYLRGVKLTYSDISTMKSTSGQGGDLKKTLNNVNDGLNATGIMAGGAEIFTRANAGARITYTTFSGATSWISSSKVVSALKGTGNTVFYTSIVVDLTLSATDNQSWTKTIFNSGVGYTCLKIGGWPGFLIGAGYTAIDKTVGWNRVLSPTPNHPGTFIDENGNMGIR